MKLNRKLTEVEVVAVAVDAVEVVAAEADLVEAEEKGEEVAGGASRLWFHTS
jgi:hypothetical protein